MLTYDTNCYKLIYDTVFIYEKKMNKFTKLIRDLLADRLEQIDAGNSNIDEESAIAIFKAV